MKRLQVIAALLLSLSISTGPLSYAHAYDKAFLASGESAGDLPTSYPQPLHHPSPFYYKDLVDLKSLDESFIIDQRYATSDNFTGRVHYDTVLCLIHKDIASRLLRAQRLAKSKGLRIKSIRCIPTGVSAAEPL